VDTLAIKVENLSFIYPDGTQALDDISFSVEPGDVFALLGPNGSGKSTTIHILTTLLKVKIGHVSVLGYDIKSEIEKIRRRLGVVFQRPSLDTGLTIWENLYFYGSLHKVPKKELKSKIDSVLSIFGLEDKADTIISSLSGGLYRRVDLARVFLGEPDILFLDEPTFGIDPAMRGQFHQLLKELCSEGELTILIATHDLIEAENLCNKIGFLKQGKLIAFATLKELKQMYSQSTVKVTFASQPLSNISDFNTTILIESPTEWVFQYKPEDNKLHDLLNYCMSISTITRIDFIEPTLEDVFLQLVEGEGTQC